MPFAFYTTSEKAWDAMLGAIAMAKRSIYMEMRIFGIPEFFYATKV